MNRVQSILKEVFGFETFWPLQEKVIAHVKLLYLAPEALLAPRTLALLSALNVDCIAIDEAHCISSRCRVESGRLT